MNKKIQEQVFNEMYKFHHKLNKKTKTSTPFDVDCSLKTILRTIELMEEDFLKKDRKEINNWVKKMHIKSWDNLLIKEKEKQTADFQKMIEDVDNNQTEQIAKYIVVLSKTDLLKSNKKEIIAWLTQQMKFKDKLLAKLGDDEVKK